LDVHLETGELWFHALELKFNQVNLFPEQDSGVALRPISVSFDSEWELCCIKFAPELKPGRYVLSIEYSGILNSALRGFYYSSEGGSSSSGIAVTQFEGTDARRALPCWDEPCFKAVFDVTLIVPKGMTALSNMPVSSKAKHDSDPNKEVFQFDRTPIMSTYLLAFVVGEFDYISKRSSRGVDVRIYTTPGKTRLAHFALDVATRALEFFESYFEIPYVLVREVDIVSYSSSLKWISSAFLISPWEPWRTGDVSHIEKSDCSSIPRRLQLKLNNKLLGQLLTSLLTCGLEMYAHLFFC
jgi:aminopeptidase N